MSRSHYALSPAERDSESLAARVDALREALKAVADAAEAGEGLTPIGLRALDALAADSGAAARAARREHGAELAARAGDGLGATERRARAALRVTADDQLRTLRAAHAALIERCSRAHSAAEARQAGADARRAAAEPGDTLAEHLLAPRGAR